MNKTPYVELLLFYFIPIATIWGYFATFGIGFILLFSILPAGPSIYELAKAILYFFMLLFVYPGLGILFVSSIIAFLHLKIKNFSSSKEENQDKQDKQENSNTSTQTNNNISIVKIIILSFVIIIGVFIIGVNIPKSLEKNEPVAAIFITSLVFFIPLILLPLIYLIKELRKK